MRTVTVSMPKHLVEQIDAIAAKDERSRSKIIERILREQVELFEQSAVQPPVKTAPKKTPQKIRPPTNTDPVPSNGAGA